MAIETNTIIWPHFKYKLILECSFRNNSNVDSPLEKINRSQYQALSNKTATGQPSQYFVQRFIDHVLITIY